MPLSHSFVFPLPNGLHARPASHLAEAVRPWQSAVTWVNERTGRSANARSVLGMAGTDTRAGDPCRLEIAGADEADALAHVQRFLADTFPKCDEPLALVPPTAVLIPRSLQAAGLARHAVGQIACRGLGIGAPVVVGGLALPATVPATGPVDAAQEQRRFAQARAAVVAAYEHQLGTARGTEAEVLRAHVSMLADPMLLDGVAAAVRAGRSAGQALVELVAAQRAALGAAESAYIRERVLDLEDVAGRLWEELSGTTLGAVPVLPGPAIVCAERLTPTQFLALDRAHLRGLVLQDGGQTSHVVILARSFGIPTLTGVADTAALRPAREIVVDANVGIAVPDPAPAVRAYYAREEAKLRAMADAAARAARQPARTADGRRVEVGANIASVAEAEAAFAQGAEGIGLLRTELLFADRQSAPDEEEQYAAYAAVVRAAAGRPVIIRTLDVGGDKPVPFLPFPVEANPFLGYRGVRFYAEHAPLIRTQLRAILRAAAHGPVKVLVPMIACVEEARFVRGVFDAVAAQLPPAAARVLLGFMIEVPATAFILDELGASADFFSLGTNDLAQYFSAADRENGRVAALNAPFHPAFLRLLRHIVMTVRARGRWIGLCGEMAEHAAALPLLVGLGLDEISLAAPRIAATKAALARLDQAACVALLAATLERATRAEVEALVAGAAAPAAPLLTPDLVLDDLVAGTKHEVIRAMVDALHRTGRTSEPAAVEEAVWQREDTYSTGFGDGFALPHGKTDALAANSIVVARLRTPVDWASMDGAPVEVVILLGIRASEHGKAHMETLARLSRRVTNDDFRAAVRRQPDPAGLVSLLAEACAPRPAAVA